MWGHLTTLFEALNTDNGWRQKHGPDWTFADVPYHLAYCNHDLVARGLELGRNYPEADRELLATIEDLNAWNEREFANRPAAQTVAQSLDQWRASCQAIRRLTEQMSDEDLARPFWMPIFRGWATAQDGLAFCLTHSWSEFTQLRLHMGRAEPIPSLAITRHYLNTMLHLFPMVLDRTAAADLTFTTVFAFTDPGLGAWTLRVADGAATVEADQIANPDLILTQSAETFEKTLRHMHDPAEAMQAGLIRVSNFEGLATFGRLFPV
jgi:hypothetical protein